MSSESGVTPPLNPESLDPSEEFVPGAATSTAGAARGLTADGRLRSGRLAGLAMPRAIWVLSWPILAESFLNSMVGLTDTVLAAGLGPAPTDAIGAASYMMWLMGLIVMSVGVGATALISRSIGARRMAVADAVLAQSMLVSLIAGSLVGLIVVVTTPLTARMLSLGPEADAAFRSYLVIIGLAMPFNTILFTGNACARGAGDSMRPLRIMIVVNVVNMALSFVLSGVDWRVSGSEGTTRVILENPFGIDMGVRGIAIGTLAAEAIGAALVLGIAVRGTWGIRLRARRLRPHWHTIRRIVRIGLPNLFETLGMWVGNYAIVLLVGLIGAGSLGAHIVAIRIEAFSFLPGFAMGAAAATLAGQYLGAGSPALARRSIWICTVIAMVTMGVTGLAFILMPRVFVGLLSSQDVHMRQAPMLLVITGFVQIPFAASIVWRSALRGVGDVKAVMLLTWWTTYAIRLPLAWLLCGVDIPLPGGRVIPNPVPWEPSLAGLWMGLCAEIVCRAGAFGWRFLKSDWESSRV